MSLWLVLSGVLVLLLGVVLVAAVEQWVPGIVTFVLGLGMIVGGIVALAQEESEARARCEAQGGTFADLRDIDLCLAPGVVLEVSR